MGVDNELEAVEGRGTVLEEEGDDDDDGPDVCSGRNI